MSEIDTDEVEEAQVEEAIKQPKAIYQHCETVYKAMLNDAEQEPEGQVYTGFTTKLFRRLGLGVPHYSLVLTELKRMGCIHQIKRGGGTAPSIWLLIQPPNEDAFNNLPETSRYALGGRKIQLQLEQRIKDLTERLNSQDERIRALEARQ